MKSPESELRIPLPVATILITLTFLTLTGCTVPSTATIPVETPDPPTLALPAPTSTSLQLQEITPSPAPSPTPDPYLGMTIADLQARSYGEGEIEIEGVLEIKDDFIRFLISYNSDGVKIYGFMNLPNGDGPFPVIVVDHGYVTPQRYQTVAYTTRYADALAQAGYLVFHPNYRNHPPSEEGPNPFRVGYAIDVLNLVGILQEGAGRPGLLEIAIPDKIGLFGHSMGGGITLRTVTVNPGITAAVLYGAISGDERANYERSAYWTNDPDGIGALETPEEDMQRISTIFHLEDIQTPLSIHHGLSDVVVPPEWSADLCARMVTLEKTVECFDYPGQPHIFTGSAHDLFMQRVIDFFDGYLKE